MAEEIDQSDQSIAYALVERGVVAQPAKRTQKPTTPRSQEVEVSLVADAVRRFPGEPLNFYVRLQPRIDLASCGLEVRLPDTLLFGNSSRLHGDGPPGPAARDIDGNLFLTFDFVDGIFAGETYEYVLHTVVRPAAGDLTADVTAVVLAGSSAGGDANGDVIRDEESLAIAVSAKSTYIRYLPSLYTHDELMGRFLMLFESFWSPVSQQIRQISNIFDPAVAPADMLPWLASWLDLQLDPEWPEAQRRALLQSARRLYTKRGTASGLREYLEIYSGGEVQIIEHRAENFVVSNRADLGNSIALGRDNQPHTFTVIVRMAVQRLGDTAQAETWHQRLSAIIDREKPVHTTYTLRIEPLDDDA